MSNHDDHEHGHEHEQENVPRTELLLPQEARVQLMEVFKKLPHDIPLYLFTSEDDDPEETELARDIGTAFAEVSNKIKFQVLDVKHKLAKKWEVTRTPTFMFAPEQYSIKYLGIPLGEEGRTLVETLILVGLRASNMNPEAKKVVAKLDSPRLVRVFVTSTCPYCPQQAVNAVKAAIENPAMVKIEIVDTNFNNDLAETYSAFSVPQTWANDVLISKGAQPEELFAASLAALEEQQFFIPSSDAAVVHTDLVIIGGGPAGLTAAIYAARSGLKAVIVERDQLGGQVATTPIVENYPGLSQIGGKNLVDIMVRHALEYVQIFPKEAVVEIKPGDPIEITTTARKFTARALLLATGASYRKLGVPGEDRFSGRGVSYCSTCDGPLFKGRRVYIVGGGDSAVTEALHLENIGVHVAIIHRRDKLRAQDYLVRDLESHNIPMLWNSEIREIRGQRKVEEIEVYNNKTKETHTIKADGVFITIGYDPETALAKMAGIEVSPDGFIKEDGRHRTNIPGVYVAGDVEGGYKQIVTAAGSGAGAAMTIFEDLMHPYWENEQRFAGVAV